MALTKRNSGLFFNRNFLYFLLCWLSRLLLFILKKPRRCTHSSRLFMLVVCYLLLWKTSLYSLYSFWFWLNLLLFLDFLNQFLISLILLSWGFPRLFFLSCLFQSGWRIKLSHINLDLLLHRAVPLCNLLNLSDPSPSSLVLVLALHPPKWLRCLLPMSCMRFCGRLNTDLLLLGKFHHLVQREWPLLIIRRRFFVLTRGMREKGILRRVVVLGKETSSGTHFIRWAFDHWVIV
jgi:hypothetical protein